MKKILTVLAILASVYTASAQKSEEAVKKAVAAAQLNCENPKKADKPATWIKLAQENVKAYKEPFGKGLMMMGVSRDILQAEGTAKPIETKNEEIKGTVLTVDIYPTCKYYFNNNALRMIKVTKTYIPTALEDAVKAYAKAAEVDPKGTKTEEIKKGIQEISTLYGDEGATNFNLGDFAAASECFRKAYTAALTEPLAVVDTTSMFNAGLAADVAGNTEEAIKDFETALAYHYSNGGDTEARLADCYKKLNRMDEAKSTLEKGFIANPQNQGILIGLINIYLDTQDDPQKIITLLKKAQDNEPANASLYYVEGNMYKQFGEADKAMEAYDKCLQADSKYPYGEIGKGILYYEKAEKIREEAQAEMNDQKYQALVEQYDATLLDSAKYFENAFEISNDPALKQNLADYLKSIYYRFREQNDQYKMAFEKYSEIAKNGIQQ